MHHRTGAFRKEPGDGGWAAASSAPKYTVTLSGETYYGVAPYDFATIYNVLPLWNAGIDGTGQTIAIVARSNIALQDVRNFRSVFGLPARDPTITLNGPDPGIPTWTMNPRTFPTSNGRAPSPRERRSTWSFRSRRLLPMAPLFRRSTPSIMMWLRC